MVFNTNYNLGFRSPQSNMCSMCLQLKGRISMAKDEAEQAALITELRVHKACAKAFFEFLQEEDQSKLILSFDCEKNIALPQLPDQSVYYSRQFYMCNFTIVNRNSKTNLGPGNVTSYMWTENEFQKDANMIAIKSVVKKCTSWHFHISKMKRIFLKDQKLTMCWCVM